MPPEIGRLRKLQRLDLSGNPWRVPFDRMTQGPLPELLAYLRSLEEATPVHEAKVLLVGEGKVGKSSLLAALSEEPFVKDRPTTHGIELRAVETEHPEGGETAPLRLNFWDFGGQEVYRIAHQFFFSPDALYLLVWNPREGQEQNELEGWLQRIWLCVGKRARVLLVATHANERRPELDYPALKARFGDLLAGQYAVDNADGTGIPDLLNQLAALAAQLKPVGVLFNPNWLAAREELLAPEQTHISYDDYRALCQRHGLGETESAALLSLLHTLGYIIYHDLDGLRDFIVLQPEWLTKAISYVLEDKAPRDAGGELQHDHLRALWLGSPVKEDRQDDHGQHGSHEASGYDEADLPYLLRLMEEFDVSVRLEGRERTSLVPQLVPWKQPALPWEPTQPTQQAQLRLLCELEHDPPGLIAWTTARNFRWSTGRHWRNGVFLRHENGDEALLDYSRGRGGHLALTVRGSYPAYFMHLLLDGLQYLIRERWPHLEYELYVPCLTEGCEGRFPLKQLQEGRSRGKHQLPCPYCWEEQDLGALLEGYLMPADSLQAQLAAMEERLLAAQRESTEEIKRLLTESQQLTRRVMRALLDEARRGPRLFTLSPTEPTRHRLDPRRLLQEPLKLTLWCEHSGHEHPLAEGYHIENPRQWVTRVAPYALLALQVLRVAAPVAGGAVGLAEKPVRERYKPDFDFMAGLVKAAGEGEDALEAGRERVDHLDAPFNRPVSRAEGQGLHAFHELLKEVGWKPGARGLRRIDDKKTGDVLWMCAEHYVIYDPGLPEV